MKKQTTVFSHFTFCFLFFRLKKMKMAVLGKMVRKVSKTQKHSTADSEHKLPIMELFHLTSNIYCN